MRAFVMRRYGGPEAAEPAEMPAPAPRGGELLVRVHAAGLNPVDFKTREGKLKIIRRYGFPQVMGNELAGVVEVIGPGVTRFAPGDRIYARVDKDVLGAFAELAVVREAHAAAMPASLDFAHAAAVPLAALTALQALRDELGVRVGQRIFISGGAGGVGTFALQLARWLGAEVATTASARGEALVKRLGATRVIDYTRERFDDVLRDYDGVLDLVGGETLERAFRVVKPGGRVVSVAGLPEPTTARKDLDGSVLLTGLFWLASAGLRRRARRAGVTYRYLFMQPSGLQLIELAGLIDDKKLEVVIDRILPFDKISEAFAHLESGHAKGKVVVTMLPTDSTDSSSAGAVPTRRSS